MLKRFLLPIGIVCAGVLTISALVVAKPKPVPRPPAEAASDIQVRVMGAAPQAMGLTVRAQGTVTPKREIDLVAQVSGQIVSAAPAFVSGGFFSPEETLVRIDERDYQAAVVTAKAQVAVAEERLAAERGQGQQARREWRDLGTSAANDLFLRKPQLAAAEANLAAARAALAMAELDLERTRIAVPFEGRIRSIAVNQGQFVAAGTPLARVYDASVLEVRLPLTEQQAALLNLPFLPPAGPTAEVPVKVFGTLAGEPHQWQGALVRTDAFVDADSRMYFAVVEVARPLSTESAEGGSTAPLLPGMFVEAEIAGKNLDGVLRLPRAALFKRDTLLVLDQDNAVQEQKVKVLRKSDTEVWVQADILPDTLIALEKQSLLTVGGTVVPVREGEAATPAVRPVASVLTDSQGG